MRLHLAPANQHLDSAKSISPVLPTYSSSSSSSYSSCSSSGFLSISVNSNLTSINFLCPFLLDFLWTFQSFLILAQHLLAKILVVASAFVFFCLLTGPNTELNLTDFLPSVFPPLLLCHLFFSSIHLLYIAAVCIYTKHTFTYLAADSTGNFKQRALWYHASAVWSLRTCFVCVCVRVCVLQRLGEQLVRPTVVLRPHTHSLLIWALDKREITSRRE